MNEASWLIGHHLQISALTTAWGSQQFWRHWSYTPSHATGQILEKKDTVTFKIINITIPITKCRQWRNCKSSGFRVWLLMALPSAAKYKVFQTSPWSDSYPLSLKASCFFSTQLFLLPARRNGRKLFRDANLPSLSAHIYLRACPSVLQVTWLIFHTHFTPLHPPKLVLVPWHKQNQIQNDCF